jgi:hypothetical protein
LQSILADRGCLDRWSDRLPAVKSISEDAREWEATYERLLATTAPSP